MGRPCYRGDSRVAVALSYDGSFVPVDAACTPIP
jgi:hypothetical protein